MGSTFAIQKLRFSLTANNFCHFILTNMDIPTPPESKKPSGSFKTILLVVVITIMTTVVTVFLLNLYLFPTAFKPVKLNAQEKQVLKAKIKRLEKSTMDDSTKAQSSAHKPNEPMLRRPARKTSKMRDSGDPITPELYREDSEKRQIRFTEREINALLARNTDLADKLAIDLSEDLASAKLLIPLDPDFPVLGGKTLRVSAGLEIRINERTPVIKLKGVSFWGVPLPNAWLGGIKNVNLVNELGGNQGFWNAFAAGVKTVKIQEGCIFIELKE